MSSAAQDSYHTPGFAEFYDLMVQALPPEFEAGTDVEAVYWPLLIGLLAPADPASGSATLRVLDVCCGSGRVALALAARWASWAGRPAHARLELTGADSSEVMLAAARAKAAAVVATTSRNSALSPAEACTLSWHCTDVAAMHSAAELAALHGRCSLAVVSAGSFHHLLTVADQLACLRGLAACLRQHPAPSFAVVNLFDQSHLQATAGVTLAVGPYRRTCLWQRRETPVDAGSSSTQAGGSTEADAGRAAPATDGTGSAAAIWRQCFLLERYASEAATAAAGSTCQALLWQQEEEWALREVASAEFERLAAEAGLRVVRRLARWADGWPGTRDGAACGAAEVLGVPLEQARIFVLRPAGGH